MNEIIEAYTSAFNIFFAGMPEGVISLAVTGIALTSSVFFASLPFLIFRK